jgi:hypothetical protein
MVVSEILSTSTYAIEGIGKTLLYLQAIGIIILIFLSLQIISYIINKKRLKELRTLNKDLNKINKKLDLIYSKIKK